MLSHPQLGWEWFEFDMIFMRSLKENVHNLGRNVEFTDICSVRQAQSGRSTTFPKSKPMTEKIKDYSWKLRLKTHSNSQTKERFETLQMIYLEIDCLTISQCNVLFLPGEMMTFFLQNTIELVQ